MKTKILLFAVVTFCTAIIFTACQKNISSAVDESTEVSMQADDESRVSSEMDATANDADVTLEATPSFSGRSMQVQSLICDATVTIDTASNPRTITITYNGTNCLGTRTRTGVVVISMAQGVRWKDAGAVLNVSFQNLKITRLSDNKSITINGTQTYTNISGGLLVNLATLGTITHTHTSSGMTIIFDNGSQRSWQVARQRVFTYNNGIVVTTTGMHTDGANTGIVEWGTNRFGNAFSSAITQPLVIRQDCDFRVTSGEVVHRRGAITATATFGLDVTGNPTSCPGTGHYYMKIVWVGAGGNTHTVILPY